MNRRGEGTIYIAPLQVRYYSEALLTQHGYCAGVSRQSATGNCELRTFPRFLYVAARVGFEPTTLRSICFDSTNAPPRPICSSCRISPRQILAFSVIAHSILNSLLFKIRLPPKSSSLLLCTSCSNANVIVVVGLTAPRVRFFRGPI